MSTAPSPFKAEEGGSGDRPITRPRFSLSAILAAGLSLAAVVWAADLPARLGAAIYTEQYLALVLAFSLCVIYLRGLILHEDRRKRIIDVGFAIISTGAALYLAIGYPSLVMRQVNMPWDAVAISAILIVAVLEAIRRTLGMMLVGVIVVVMSFGLFGHLISGPLQTRYVPPERILVYLGIDSNGMLGITLAIAATIVIAFILFGQLLLAIGAGNFFNDLALGLMGRRRGGSAKIAIVGSGLFGTISGVVVSNIVATGVITIKIMIDGGYRRTSAAAIEATASTGGQILPPIMGAVAFLMAEILQIPYSEVVVAAIVPALLFYVAIFVQADLEAAKKRIAPLPPEMIPPLGETLKKGWPFLIPFAVVVLGLFSFNLRPDTAAFYGAVSALVIGLFTGYGTSRLTLPVAWQALVRTGEAVIDVVLIAAAAGFLIGMLNLTGLGFGLSYTLVQLGSSSMFLLLLIAAIVCVILGMGMPTVGVYLVLAVMVAPALVDVGIDPIAAHLFIFYLGMMSMVTPPVGIAAFFAASIASADKMRTALEAMRFGWVAYVIPFLFVVTPSLLLEGPWWRIALDVGAAIIGVWLISAAFVGFLRHDLGHVQRLIIAAIGIALLWPDHMIIGQAPLIDAVALAALAIVWRLQRPAVVAPAPTAE